MRLPTSTLIRRALLALAALATLVALFAGYARHQLLDSDRFAERALTVVRSEPMREQLAETFADSLIGQRPRLIAARPALIDAADRVLAGDAAGGLITRLAVDAHRSVFADDRRSVLLNLADLQIVVGQFLESTDPALAERVRRTDTTTTALFANTDWAAPALRAARTVTLAALIAPLLAIALLGAGVAAAPTRPRGTFEAGVALLAAAGIAVVLMVALRTAAVAGTEAADEAIVRAMLGGFLDPFWWWAGAVALAGGLLAASAAALIGPMQPSALPRAAWSLLSATPASGARQVARAVLLIVLGGAVIAQPRAAVTLAAAGAGAVITLTGLIALMQALGGDQAPAPGVRAARRRRAAAGAAGIAGLVALSAAAIVLAASSDDVRLPSLLTGSDCNGSDALCDRRLDQVVFASSHNANATAADGYLNANHAMSMTGQLDVGVRGLLIDAVEGQRNERGVVRTNLEGETRATIVAKIGEQGLASAQRLAGSVVFGPLPGDTAPFLCHVMCEVGAVPLADGLREIREWLDRNPREVLVIFLQDDAPMSQIREAFEQSGLRDQAFTAESGQPLPTLAQLIAADRRAFVMAEQNGRAGDWMHEGFVLTQDTRYDFERTGELAEPASCDLNRGRPDSPLLLVNHWVESYPPDPVDADVINTREAILERARRCAKARDRVPNLVAVDFVERGDLIAATEELNAELP